MSAQPRFVLRTVRKGRARILGHDYASDVPWPEHLEGIRVAFGLYWGPPNHEYYDERGLANFVDLWGTEEMYRAVRDSDEETFSALYDACPLWPDRVHVYNFRRVSE